MCTHTPLREPFYAHVLQTAKSSSDQPPPGQLPQH